MGHIFEEMYLSMGQQGIMFLRILLSGICGALIGTERSHRQKEAGIRTHILVAMGAAIAMVVSKYGFFDVVIYDSVQLDASRIASNVMTGVGFLGAGMIFTRSGSIRGLTTAAGIWATAGIGLAIGAGLYIVGILTTAVVLLVHIFKDRLVHFEGNATDSVEVHIDNDEHSIALLLRQLEEHGIKVISSELHKETDGSLKLILAVKTLHGITLEQKTRILGENKSIRSLIT